MYKVLESFKGSPDGHTVKQYKKGEAFTETGDLLKVALENKWVGTDKNKEPTKAELKAAETAAKKTALEADLEKLNQDLTGADDDSKVNIEAEITSKQAELAALK